ncbi:RepA leader peptide Tap [Salmonella enterica]|nr:RepA leader peptide Tap [Salmonella enterica]
MPHHKSGRELVLMRCLPGTRIAKTPIIFSFLGGNERLTGSKLNRTEAVALYGEYRYMPREFQYFLSLLLPGNISAGRCD